MKLIYNVVINTNVDNVWNFLENLENQGILINNLSIEKKSPNDYIFHIKNKFKTKSYRTVLLDKQDCKKISFCMVDKGVKIIKIYYFSNNGIETYIKHCTKIQVDNWFEKLIKYPIYMLSFRKKRKAEFDALKKQFIK